MTTTFGHPDRLSVPCDARLKPLLAEVARARRQPPGGVLEVIARACYTSAHATSQLPGYYAVDDIVSVQCPLPGRRARRLRAELDVGVAARKAL